MVPFRAWFAVRTLATQTSPRAPEDVITTSARPRRVVRPILLLLVFGAFLVIVGATASGQAVLVTADTSTTLLNAQVGSDVATVRSFVGLNLTQADLQQGGPTAARRATLERGLSLLAERGGILHAALLAPDGTVLASDDGTSRDRAAPATEGLDRALRLGQADALITDATGAGALAALPATSVLREYLPIVDEGQTRAVVAIWRDAAPILAQLDDTRNRVVLITLSAAIVTAVVLFLIFRAAQGRLTRQTIQLLEAARRDPLTGALNHGALVETLAGMVEAARKTDGALSVALVDIDNFGLLNDTYSHPAGDRVLREVGVLLASLLPPDATWGRYGPDEFLVISPPQSPDALGPALEELRAELVEHSIEFEGSERLPVSVSAGVVAYPSIGESVTSLLSLAALTLDEARAGGGDAIRVAEAKPVAASYARTFDILQGLVIAVDTKDRYTRHHSEDVARYAEFLARQLELDPDMRRAIHTAGLLHDVGKIGIPDIILRKPGRLSEEERQIVQQHVALGDMIVRDLPGLELIRAGIRYHHERWDGRGYLDRLAGDDVPFVGRILAVADAFSAMTTTRRYRKAIPIEEALRRLEDAAGSQLDARLVEAFVRAIWTDATAPLPGTSLRADQTQPLSDRQVA